MPLRVPSGGVRTTSVPLAIGLVVGSLLLTWLLGEIGIRIFHPSASLWSYPNYIDLATRPDPDQPPEILRYDPVLGWEPVPGSSGILMHQPITYSPEGLRNQNLQFELPAGRPILAVGDSYTEGYGVKDDETWPAHLERDLRKHVLNGGVRGYGLDQIVLRAEKLIGRFNPEIVILGFIASDMERAGMMVRESVHKPYFVPAGEGLDLRNVPVPTTPFVAPHAWPRRIFGHSYLLDFIMRRLGAYYLWYGDGVSTEVDDVLISCRLMHRFADLVRKHEARALVVALPQYNWWREPRVALRERQASSKVLDCAQRRGLQTLDTYDAFVAAGAARDPASLYVDWHFNDRGNALAAKSIAEALRRMP